MTKIVLVGYMAVGKSTIGKLIAEKLQISFIDLDKMIEKSENLTINELFAKYGEIYFRKKEHIEFKKWLAHPDAMVIATGGGTPCYADNHLFLNGFGITSIYLKASIAVLYRRLQLEPFNRPLVAGKSEEELKEYIAKNLFDRSYFYHQAKHIVTVDHKSAATITEEILQLLY